MQMETALKELTIEVKELTIDVKGLLQSNIRQEEQLRYHIKRSDLLEEAVGLQRAEAAAAIEALKKQLEPIKRHVDLVNSICKIFVAITGVAASAAAVYAAWPLKH